MIRRRPGGDGRGTVPEVAERPRWDIIIAGAGPAGSRAAELLARHGASVLLLDPKAPWEKPCGGGLTAAALRNTPELRELASDAETIDELLVICPSGASIVLPLRDPYLVVSRLRLSQWGLERAREAGAVLLRESVRTADRDARGWRIIDSQGEVHYARRLVAADGANSKLRRLLAHDLRPELAPVRVAYPAHGTPAGRAVFLFLAAADGYLWDFPRPDRHSVGIGVLARTFGREALDQAIAQYRLAETGETAPAEHHGAVIATSSWSSGSFELLGGRDYALLGDAAGLADPATGEGIDYALRSASLAAKVFSDEGSFRQYPAAVRAEFGREMRRARLVRERLYRPAAVDWIVRWARRSPRGALVLMSLFDAVNEHRSLRRAVVRGLFSRIPRGHPARAVCACPDGKGEPMPADGRGQSAVEPEDDAGVASKRAVSA